MLFARKVILCCFLILSLAFAGCTPTDGKKLTERKIYTNTEFKFSLNYPESWYFIDDSLPEQINILLSKEELSIARMNPAALSIVGLKGKEGKEFMESYENEFDKKDIESKSFKVSKEITADKYFADEGVCYLMFSYED